jgi:antitoxin component of RelBE/YafQ-DinJ toxin-antitoxin module
MSKTANIRARVEPELKAEVGDILSDLGLTVSETVQVRTTRIQRRGKNAVVIRIPANVDA